MKPKIALIDSGIGGLTIFRKFIPESSNITYLADNKYFPYGVRSDVELINVIDRLLYYFLNNQYEKVFLTCNTASTIYSKFLKYKYRDNVIPIFDKTIEELDNSENLSHIGIIATNQVVRSGLYEKLIKEKFNVKITNHPASELVALCENYDLKAIREYLNKHFPIFKEKKIDTLILACTHFNLIEKEIKAYFNNEVKIICSGYRFLDLIRKNYLCYTCGENVIYLTSYQKSYIDKIYNLFKDLKKIKILSLNI